MNQEDMESRICGLEVITERMIQTMDGMRSVMESQSKIATEQGKAIAGLSTLVHEIQNMLLRQLGRAN